MEKEEIKKKVLYLLAEMFDLVDVKDEDRLKDDLGLDSLDVVELIVYLERDFKVHFDSAFESKTVSELVDKVYELQKV
jgi:acyl carrier protein